MFLLTGKGLRRCESSKNREKQYWCPVSYYGVLILELLIPLVFINSIVRERAGWRRQAIMEITSK